MLFNYSGVACALKCDSAFLSLKIKAPRTCKLVLVLPIRASSQKCGLQSTHLLAMRPKAVQTSDSRLRILTSRLRSTHSTFATSAMHSFDFPRILKQTFKHDDGQTNCTGWSQT